METTEKPKSKYVTVNIEPAAREAVHSLAALLTGREGRRLTLSETLILAEKIVRGQA